jgi:two-component system sensor histidine kinase PilS (NtrC family)
MVMVFLTLIIPLGKLRLEIIILITGYAVAAVAYVVLQPDRAANLQIYLFGCFITDIAFLLIAIDRSGEPLMTLLIMPLLLAHGWMLRSRIALLHAGIVTLCLLIYQLLTSQQFNLNIFALLGLMGFGISIFGMILGRYSGDTEALAFAQASQIHQLAAVNELIINDMQDGILVIDRDGFVVQSNQQAQDMLVGPQHHHAQKLFKSAHAISDLSPTLHKRWSAWRHGETISDTGSFLARDGKRRLQARLMSSDLRRRGDIIIFIEDLARAQKQAQQMKLGSLGRLTASIAHEIRNPLSAIKQSAQLIAEDTNQPESRHLLSIVDKNVLRIERIIESVMSLSKRDKTKVQSINLSPFLLGVINELPATHKIPKGSVECESNKPLWVRADHGHLEEVLYNLLSNAWRHASKTPGCIKILCVHKASQVDINIVDDGPGVSATMIDNLFEPFVSGSNSAGLGLFLSKELMQANGGDLTHVLLDKGACFRITLASANTP